jgi:uncharacterized damage-inducible protein DinB
MRVHCVHQFHDILARLASERGGLIAQLLYLYDHTLTHKPINDEWTVKDLLAHLAAWDGWQHRVMSKLADGQSPDLSALEDFSASNATFVAERRGARLEDVLSEMQAARKHWTAWLAGLPLETFYQVRSHDGQDWTFSGAAVRVMWEHDAYHAARIAEWRDRLSLGGESGSKAVLRAALAAVRKELLAAAATIPVEERSSRAVCGTWTLQDVLGHIADWERLGADGLAHMAAGQAPHVEHVIDIDVWNVAHVDARRGQSWEQVWTDLCTARQALTETLAGMSQADLDPFYHFPWGPEGTPYQWAVIYVDHERSHARGLQEYSRVSIL